MIKLLIASAVMLMAAQDDAPPGSTGGAPPTQGPPPDKDKPEAKAKPPKEPAKLPHLGDKTPAYVVWYVKTGGVAKSLKKYQGRVVGGRIFTEALAKQIIEHGVNAFKMEEPPAEEEQGDSEEA